MKTRLNIRASLGLVLAMIGAAGIQAATPPAQDAKPLAMDLYTLTLTDKGGMEFVVDVPAYQDESSPIQINVFSDSPNSKSFDNFIVVVKKVGNEVAIQLKGTHHANDGSPDVAIGVFNEAVSINASGKGGIRHGDLHLRIQKVASYDVDAAVKNTYHRA